MPTDHLDEEQVRVLLARAASTIVVDDPARVALTGLPEPSRRRWPTLLAAASAVVVLLLGGVLVAGQVGDEAPVPAPSPSVDGRPVEQEHVFSEDQVPSVVGSTRAEAVRLLEAAGLAVRTRVQKVYCGPDGLVSGSHPAAGAVVAPGDRVTIRVMEAQPVIDCVGEPPADLVWQLVRFARGLDGPPPLADEVTLRVADGAPATLSRAEATDPDAWTICADGECHSALGALAEQASRAWTLGDEPVVPYLDLVWGYDRAWCPAFRGVRGLHAFFTVPTDGIDPCPSTAVNVGWNRQGELETVRLQLTPATPDGDEQIALDADRQAAATAFVDWARAAGPAPEFAEQVRNLYDGQPGVGAPAWNTEPQDRAGWAACSGLGFPDCALDPVATLLEYDGRVVATAGRSTCPESGAVPAELTAATSDVVRLSTPEPARCSDAWAVELWVTDDGNIYAVNLLTPA